MGKLGNFGGTFKMRILKGIMTGEPVGTHLGEPTGARDIAPPLVNGKNPISYAQLRNKSKSGAGRLNLICFEKIELWRNIVYIILHFFTYFIHMCYIMFIYRILHVFTSFVQFAYNCIS